MTRCQNKLKFFEFLGKEKCERKRKEKCENVLNFYFSSLFVRDFSQL